MVTMHSMRGQRLAVILAALNLAPVAARAEWYHREEAIMGTSVGVELWADDPALAERAMTAVIDEMRRTDELMSTYKPDSQVSRVNAEAALHPVEVDPTIADVVDKALGFSRLSGGAFDITYASVGYLYDFRHHQHPDDAAIAKALPGVDYRQVVVDREHNTIRFLKNGVRIDLGGIAKGYTVDRCVEMLKKMGIEHAMVNAGGDTRLLGDRRGRPWIVGIRDPREKGKVVTKLPLEDEAISTSGDYERYFVENGVRYHHIIVPGTGRPADAVRSVTIVASNATLTEGLTKSVFVLGVERGMALIATIDDVDAVVVDKDGKIFYSDGLTPEQ